MPKEAMRLAAAVPFPLDVIASAVIVTPTPRSEEELVSHYDKAGWPTHLEVCLLLFRSAGIYHDTKARHKVKDTQLQEKTTRIRARDSYNHNTKQLYF